MKARILVAFAASLFAAEAYAQQVSLVGTWAGQRERIAKVEGYRDGVATLVITEQKGRRTFKGYLNRSNKDGDVKEDLWGAFSPDGRLMVGSDEEGIYSFMMINPNTLDYCYVEAGASPRSVCARLVRQKKK